MNRIMTLASVAVLGLAVAGCGGKGDSGGNAAVDDAAMMTSNEAVMSDDMTADGNAMAPAAAAMTGKDFADAAAKSDAFEIAAAKLAQTKGTAAVKDFAAMMIDAHTKSTAKIKAAAGEASPAITPDPALKPDQQAKLDDLGKLSGAAFDKAYGAGQVAAHEEALATMQGYAASGDVPSLKTVAGEIAPDVAKHLEMAKALPM